MATQDSYGSLLFYPPSQIAGQLQLSSRVATCIEGRKDLSFVPFAFAFAEPSNVLGRYRISAGRFSPTYQVWEYDPALHGSTNLVPRVRRVLQS